MKRCSPPIARCSCRVQIDDKEIQLKNQSQAFFQISGAGHEAILVAAGTSPASRSRLVLSVLPRSRAVPDDRRHAARDVPSLGWSERRPGESGGRQMPSHWGHKSAEHSVSKQLRSGRSASTRLVALRPALIYSAFPRSSAVQRSTSRTRSPTFRLATARRARANSGSRSTRRARKKLPILYLVEDNGYAISVPVEVQTPGGDISRLVEYVSGTADLPLRRHRLSRQLSNHARCGLARS